MAESEPAPEIGAIRHAEDGTLEAFDGRSWAPYAAPRDRYRAPVFKGAPEDEELPGGPLDRRPEPRP
jgi:hypothetical protein